MAALFGTVEYFEREFLTYAEKTDLGRLSKAQISAIHSTLKEELLTHFVCTERIRTECLENLAQAHCNLTHSDMSVMS